MHFEATQVELHVLKQQHTEKLSQLFMETAYFRNMYQMSDSANQQTQRELSTVKTINAELMADKSKLQENLVQVFSLFCFISTFIVVIV